MPETGIGLFPDVGGGWYLSRLEAASGSSSRSPARGSMAQNASRSASPEFGVACPAGFIITTEVFRCRQVIDSYRPAEKNFKDQIARHIILLEKMTGKIFGNPENPLLFSVRSGSSSFQPGMMDTFLNVGINEKVAGGLAARTGNP